MSYRTEDVTWTSVGTDGKPKESTIKGEDVILITKDKDGHQIFSLSQVEPPPEPSSKDLPFELKATSAMHIPKAALEAHLFRGIPAQLGPDREIHVLISTLSGVGIASMFFDAVLKLILGVIGLDQLKYTVPTTRNPDSVKDFASSVLMPKASEGVKQTVLMLSGDGGVVDILNGIMEQGELSDTYTRPILSQFPFGTGNALFHSVHRPSPLSSIYIQGLRTLLHGTPRPLPFFRACFSLGARLLTNEGQTATSLPNHTLCGAVVASYGLHSTLVADSDTTEYRKHGDKRFGMVAQDLLFPSEGGPHAYQASLTLFHSSASSAEPEKEVTSRKEHGYILATLVSNLEKTFTISPASKPLDGKLRVVHFGPKSGDETMGLMKKAYEEGKHVEEEGVEYTEVQGLRVEFREQGENWKWRRVCVDGLIVGVEEGGWMEVRTMSGKEAVDVVVDV